MGSLANSARLGGGIRVKDGLAVLAGFVTHHMAVEVREDCVPL